MLKKLTHIIFVFIASLVLLAHLFVPHHQHHNQVCFIAVDYAHNVDSNEHNTECHDCQKHHKERTRKEHSHSTNEVCCMLQQVYTIPSATSDKLNNKFYLSLISHPVFNTAVHFANFKTDSFFVNIPLEPPIYLPSFYTAISNQTAGWRAPPVA